MFYAYWNATFLALLFPSIVVNFAIGRKLQAIARDSGMPSRLWLVVGLVWNLALLGYFKYANFFIDNVECGLRHACRDCAHRVAVAPERFRWQPDRRHGLAFALLLFTRFDRRRYAWRYRRSAIRSIMYAAS